MKKTHSLDSPGRRRAIQSLGSGLILAGLTRKSMGSIGGAGRAMGGIGSGSGGFYPSGHWIAAKQAMIQIYPRPDTETSTSARHRWAYYDGTNAVQYSIPIGVAFGAYPYVFELLAGPPGMTISQPIYNGFQNFAYGRVTWTPTGSVSGATVSVKVTDQQLNTLTITWTVSTSSSTAHFVFVDMASGNDSNNGAIGTPYATIAGAFGSTYAANINAGANCYVRGNASKYALPIYSDSGFSSNFQPDTAKKPISLMAYPGESVTFDTSLCHMLMSGTTSDLFMQGFTCSGYLSTLADYVGFGLFGSSNSANDRMTFDSIIWNGIGPGTGGTNNDSMFFSNDTGSLSIIKHYLFITDCQELNRVSGSPGNNYGGFNFYMLTNALVQRFSVISASANMDGACYMKSDVQNGCIRENFLSCAGSPHFASYGQQPNGNMINSETCYNKGINPIAIWLPQGVGGTGPLWAYRNSIIAESGNQLGLQTVTSLANSNGPWVYESNAVQTSRSPVPNTGTSIQSIGNTVVASGLLDSTACNLTGSHANPPSGGGILGTVGAQISATA